MVHHETSWKTSAAEKLLATSCSRIPTVARYTLDVLTGNVPAGRMVFLAVERFLNDLARSSAAERKPKEYRDQTEKTSDVEGAHSFPFYFDQGGAVSIIKFFRDLAFKTKPPVAYEQFILANLFGWKKLDGFRRYQRAYIEIGKGNRKTPLAAGIGLYGIVADEESSAEVYVVAPTKDQAAICFKDAATIVDAQPELKKLVKKYGCSNKYTSGNLSHGTCFMRPLAADRDNLDGPRPHMVIADELHEHKDSQVVDKLTAGFKARTQPLAFEITNSGWDPATICYQHHDYSRQILEKIVHNEAWFAYVCQLDVCPECRAKGKESPSCDNCDNWLDEDLWIKANPGLDSVLPREYLHTQVKEALELPANRNLTQRLNFCIWTQSEERFISPEAWRACAWEESLAALSS